jgi:4-amino-4-deoxy-L-arabinose transferase-like glycosyltransferase
LQRATHPSGHNHSQHVFTILLPPRRFEGRHRGSDACSAIVRTAGTGSKSNTSIARLAVFALLAFLYLFGLGAGTLWDNSEPTYGEIAKEILRTGDWLTLHLNFKPWFVHPPLWFWAAAASARAFGLDAFSLRLPSAVFGLLCALVTYAAARALFDELTATLAALVLGTSLEVIVLSRMAILDTLLLFCTAGACFAGAVAVQRSQRRYFWIAVLAAACGTLSKGPVAVLIPLLVVFSYALVSGRRRQLRQLPWAAGALLYMAIGGSWFVVQTSLHGIQFAQRYFGLSTVGRFLSPFENQPGPFYYYVPVIVVGFFPWIAFVPKALKEAWSKRADAERFLLCYALVPFVFFSLAQTKLPNYIALCYPPLAVLVACTFAQAIRANDLHALRGGLFMLPASLLFLSAALVIYGRLHYLGQTLALVPALELLAWVIVAAAALTLALTLLARRAWLAPLGLGIMMAAFVGALVLAALPQAERFKPMPAMAAKVMALWHSGDHVGATGVSGGFSLLFYTETHGVTFIAGDMSPRQFFALPGRVLCVIRPQDYAGLRAMGIKTWLIAKQQNLWLVSNRRLTYKNAAR